MKKVSVLSFIFLILIGTVNSQSIKLKNKIDSVSYSLGVNIGKNIKKSGADKFNFEIISKAIEASIKGDKQMIEDENMSKILEAYFEGIQKEKLGKNKSAGEAFLKKNKERKGVITTASGLQYEIISVGTGVLPTDTDMVKVHYNGMLIDGTVFDSSIKRGQPVTFPVNGVIPGWTEALKIMPVGSKWKLYIPSELGYGERGAGGVIEANATLIFEVELISIEKKEANVEMK